MVTITSLERISMFLRSNKEQEYTASQIMRQLETGYKTVLDTLIYLHGDGSVTKRVDGDKVFYKWVAGK